MLTLLFIISLIGFITFIVLTCKVKRQNRWNEDECYEGFVASSIIFGIFFLITTGFLIALLGTNACNKAYKQQIEMLEEENQKIDTELKSIVKEYIDWESDVYDQFKNESAITLVQLYPELKSNELVQKQVEVFLSNREEIKSLKKKIINNQTIKWWLYFGG